MNTTLPEYFGLILIALATLLIIATLILIFVLARQQKTRHQHALANAQWHSESALLTQQLSHAQETLHQTQETLNQLREELAQTDAENKKLSDEVLRKNIHLQQFTQLNEEKKHLQAALSQLEQDNVRQQTLRQKENAANQEKIALMMRIREEMTAQFAQLADGILEDKSKRFLEQNQSNLHALLNPVQEKIHQFGQLVQESYLKEAKERGVLTLAVENLQKLNHQLNQEAQSLTRALTGANNKTQGVWGEMILEKVLEYSGLRKNHEYALQAALSRQEDSGQKRYQPDAIVYLPDNKCVVIDAKVSLNDYVHYVNSQEPDVKNGALKAHLQSLRRHVKNLSEKNYHDLPTGMNLDFVLLFVPIEPAYLLALQEDETLLQDALNANIMPVGPGNLLAVLRTIGGVWRYENQSRNAQAIAEEGGKLYDKFVGMMATFEKLGNSLETSLANYQNAMKQMNSGRGNIVSRLEKLHQMGIKANKRLPEHQLPDHIDTDDID